MNTDEFILFIEINDENYIFVAGICDESENFKVVEKIISPNTGIEKNKFTSLDESSSEIKKNIELLEIKLNYVFKKAFVIIDNFDYNCINISGFKKLNGSQVLKENISYILNSLKLTIIENEKDKSILHIFNSKSTLDGIEIDNLPIGLFGDFYSHELTFFLIKNNVLKNIKQILNKNNLGLSKVFLKGFSDGTKLINQYNTETFYKIKINKKTSTLSFFDHSSFKYTEKFNFGTDIIYQDISKICSIDNNLIKKFLSENNLENKNVENSLFVEEKYFLKENYRKIRKKLILDIAEARIEEIANIILNQNLNLDYLKKSNIKIFITIQDQLIADHFEDFLKSYFFEKNNQEPNFINEFKIEELIANTYKLISYGWKKEAIPIIQTKNSLITRIFKALFG